MEKYKLQEKIFQGQEQEGQQDLRTACPSRYIVIILQISQTAGQDWTMLIQKENKSNIYMYVCNLIFV